MNNLRNTLFVCIWAPLLPLAAARASLNDDLNALYKKYTRESVVRKVERDNPKIVEAAAETKVPEDALAPKQAAEESGFRLFKKQPFPLLFRRSYSEVTSGEDPSISDPNESVRLTEPAQFSYSHDYVFHADQWSVVGAVIAPIKILDRRDSPAPQEGMEIQLLQVVPSVSFNRVTNDVDTSKAVDELTFRVGLFSQWLGILGPFRLINLSGYGTYATNSEFSDDGIVAGEFDLEPITNLPGQRTFYRLLPNGKRDKGREGSLIEFHWKAYVHTEFGGHTGESTQSISSEDFFRIGPVLSLQLDPFVLRRLNASVSYTYLGGTGSPNDSHHFLAKLGLILDRNPDTDHWTLNATYEDGDTPLVQTRVRAFLLSLGVKY
jgi:hypothetical protein